ncbi:MAG: DNA repair protein RecN [Chitinophagales bacterium]
MLQKLTVKNYAIIDRLQMEPVEGVNIITGETGAGKSILLGALGLILGERADAKALYQQGEKCVVEATFRLDKKKHYQFFEEEELDFDENTLIRREITPNGKSRAFINDTPVTLTQLRRLSEQLVHLHSQHETLELIDTGFQLSLLDDLAGTHDLLEKYRTQFNSYRQLSAHLEEKKKQQQADRTTFDFLQFQYRELADAQLQPGEQEPLEKEQQTLTHVASIVRGAQLAARMLHDGEPSAVDQLREAQAQLKPLLKINADVAALNQRLETTIIEIKDVAAELEHLATATTLDPERLEDITGRLNTIYKLQKKHGQQTLDELLAFQASLEEKLKAMDTSDEVLARLSAEVETASTLAAATAEKLHQQRLSVIPAFKKNIEKLLHQAGMPNALFEVETEKRTFNSATSSGITGVDFLFTSNKGFAPQPVRKVASGGELSRLMLCIKSQQAGSGQLPTLIFDEIDQGISGEVALKVSEIMAAMGKKHQLLCITHLPQIARIAHKHFYIYKETVKGKTATQLRELSAEARVEELAKMLGGEKVTAAALANAKELMARN